MSTVTAHVDVAVPVRTAYNQWTQFEEFPRFMEGVQEVRQVSDTMTHWVTEVAGVKREFDAKITEQRPDERGAWTSTQGVKQAGVVLRYIAAARDAGLGVVFITHNPHHAYLVGDHFIILKLGQRVLDKKRSEVSLEELTAEMAGGQELAELSHELGKR